MSSLNIRLYFLNIVLVAAILLITAGCKSTEPPVREIKDTGYYQNVLGSDRVRDQIISGFNSVRRIQNNVIYRTYQFNEENLPRRSDLEEVFFGDLSIRQQTDSHVTTGTATVLYSRGSRALLLTAAHTVVNPDTVWHYKPDTSHLPDPFVKAVSVKESLDQHVFSDSGILEIEVISHDARKDLALMITKEDVSGIDNLKQLGFSGGNTNELQWGDVVFAMGYPRGVQMVSKGVVSRSNHPSRSIILDLSMNRGFSGGPAFAVRENGDFEWVGVVTSAMGNREFNLVPGPQLDQEFNPDLPYRGEIYISSTMRIYYGITNVVDIDDVRGFLMENHTVLRRYGISLRSF